MLLPGSVFPPTGSQRALEVLGRNLYVANSRLCPGLGLFSAVPIAKGVPLGLYAGMIRDAAEPTNAYTMAIQNSKVVVDGTPDPLLPWTWLGYMNCHRSNPDLNNVKVFRNLIVKTSCKVAAHEELTIDYSDAYPWVACDVQRFRLALDFTRACLPLLGAELWSAELDYLSWLSASCPVEGIDEALMGDTASFPLWYTLTQGLRENHPRLLHPYVPSSHPDDSFSTWLCRFCSCIAVEHLLSWKDQWQGAYELRPPSFTPAAIPEAKHHRSAHNHSRILDPACPLRGLQVDRITPWTHPELGISHWRSLMEPVQPSSPSVSGGDGVVTPLPSTLPTERGVLTPVPRAVLQRSSPEGDPPLVERSPSPPSPPADIGRDRGLAQASSGRSCLQDWRSMDASPAVCPTFTSRSSP